MQLRLCGVSEVDLARSALLVIGLANGSSI
jgi:hypothetical protein